MLILKVGRSPKVRKTRFSWFIHRHKLAKNFLMILAHVQDLNWK